MSVSGYCAPAVDGPSAKRGVGCWDDEGCFVVAPDGASLPYADVAGFADVLEAGGFDGVVLSEIPLGPELDPRSG